MKIEIMGDRREAGNLFKELDTPDAELMERAGDTGLNSSGRTGEYEGYRVKDEGKTRNILILRSDERGILQERLTRRRNWMVAGKLILSEEKTCK